MRPGSSSDTVNFFFADIFLYRNIAFPHKDNSNNNNNNDDDDDDDGDDDEDNDNNTNNNIDKNGSINECTVY